MTDSTRQTTGVEVVVSGQPLAQRSQHSPTRPWADPDQALRPATPEDFMRELSACLALVAAAGMTDEARTEWLITARASLTGIPSDLLARGAAVARKYCDHPSKIVPTIMREIESAWENRKRDQRPEHREDIPSGPKCYATAEEVAAIKAEFKLDGLGDEKARDLGPLHIPRATVQAVELADHEVPSISGMTTAEIFAQRDRIRAEKLGYPTVEPVPEEYERYFEAAEG